MGDNAFGSMPSHSSSKLYGGLVECIFLLLTSLQISHPCLEVILFHLSRVTPPSTLEMLVPANAVGKVLGKGGANIANIRKVLLSFSPISLVFD